MGHCGRVGCKKYREIRSYAGQHTAISKHKGPVQDLGKGVGCPGNCYLPTTDTWNFTYMLVTLCP